MSEVHGNEYSRSGTVCCPIKNIAVKEDNYLELIELKVTTRTKTGNGPARVLRREGKIPAILYGPETEPVMLSIPAKAFEKALKESRASQPVFNLMVEGGSTPPPDRDDQGAADQPAFTEKPPCGFLQNRYGPQNSGQRAHRCHRQVGGG